jgi:hypothetical protein
MAHSCEYSDTQWDGHREHAVQRGFPGDNTGAVDVGGSDYGDSGELPDSGVGAAAVPADAAGVDPSDGGAARDAALCAGTRDRDRAVQPVFIARKDAAANCPLNHNPK